jgi:hypothetical protein
MALPQDIIQAIRQHLENEVCPFYTEKDVNIDMNNFKKIIGLDADETRISVKDAERRLLLRSYQYDTVKMIQDWIFHETKYTVPEQLIQSVLPLSQPNIPVENVVILAKNMGAVLDTPSDIYMNTFLFAEKYGTYKSKQAETVKYMKYGNIGVSVRCTIETQWKDGFTHRAENIMAYTPNRSGWVHLFLLEDCVQFIISGIGHKDLWKYLSDPAFMRGAIYEKAHAYECYDDDYEKYDEILDSIRPVADIDNEINAILNGRNLH